MEGRVDVDGNNLYRALSLTLLGHIRFHSTYSI